MGTGVEARSQLKGSCRRQGRHTSYLDWNSSSGDGHIRAPFSYVLEMELTILASGLM